MELETSEPSLSVMLAHLSTLSAVTLTDLYSPRSQVWYVVSCLVVEGHALVLGSAVKDYKDLGFV